MYSIGVDIGGSHISCAMYEHTNKSIVPGTLVNKKVNTQGSAEEIIADWVWAISKSIEHGGHQVRGVGIAMPGPFDYYNGISLISGVNKLEALYKVDVRQELARRLSCKAHDIRFINDASAFSIAEAQVGSGAGFDRVVAITLGTGLGASFLRKGKPVIEEADVPEGGFLYNQPYAGEQADDHFSTRGILKIYKQLSGQELDSVRILSERAPDDPLAISAFEDFGNKLGKFLFPYLKRFDAQVLILGGNISRAHRSFVPSLEKAIPQVEIQVSEFGEKAAIIGGALLLEDDFYQSLVPTIKAM